MCRAMQRQRSGRPRVQRWPIARRAAQRGVELVSRRNSTGAIASLLTNETMSFFFSSRRRHTRLQGDWSSDVCSSDLVLINAAVDSRTGIDEYACGRSGIGGSEGTWRDAEDGVLSMNAIQQGAVDSTIEIGRASGRERV